MTVPASLSKWAHPPRSNTPRSSSSGPPGPCITPSTETCVVVVSFMVAVPFSLSLSLEPTVNLLPAPTNDRLAHETDRLTGPVSRTRQDHAGSMSLPFLDRIGSVHAARLKQQGRRFPLFIFEIITSTRRLRVSGSWLALTERTQSLRAIGVLAFHRSC